MHLLNQWLPEPVAREAAEEPARFSAVVRALRDSWIEGKGRPGGGGTLKWVSVVNSFINSKSDLVVEDVHAVVELAVEVILEYPGELFTQIRWMSSASRLLRRYRHVLKLTLPWRPFLNILLTRHFSRGGASSYRGTTTQIHLSVLQQFIRRSRRFFPAGSAAEIWAHLRPYFANLARNDALEGAALLALFLPTTSAHGPPAPLCPWGAWLPEWVSLWAQVPNCPFWDAQWLDILSRCAKHLPAESLDPSAWSPFLPFIFQSVLNGLGLPVGQSPASTSSLTRGIPASCAALRGVWGGRAKAGAKLIVWLLPKRVLGSPESGSLPDAAPQAQSPLGMLQALVNMVEQFYHPSNGGEWNRALEHLLSGLGTHFLKLLRSPQTSPGGGVSAGLSPSEVKCFVTAVMRLIHRRGIYSKSASLTEASCVVAGQLAYVAPSVVVPLVLEMFETAITTDTATHQLETAITTLALAVRPLLLAASASAAAMELEGGDAQGEGGRRILWEVPAETVDRAQVVLTEAMFAVLPGIDANDPPKTLAAFQFYAAVLSSTAPGSEHPLLAGLDWALWLQELLSRLFTLFTHLEEPQKNHESFLLDERKGACLRPLLELLFATTGASAADLVRQGISSTSRFLRESTVLPAAVSGIGSLCAALAEGDGAAACQALMLPLLADATDILSASQQSPLINLDASAALTSEPPGSGSGPKLSESLECAYAFKLGIVRRIVPFCGPHLPPHRDALLRLLRLGLCSTSQKVNEESASLLRVLLSSLLSTYPERYRTLEALGAGEAPVTPWLSLKSPPDWAQAQGPLWHTASAPEVDLAQAIMGEHFQGALGDIRWLCSGGASSSALVSDKDLWRVALLRLSHCLAGLQTCLPDLGQPQGQEPGVGEELKGVAGSAGVTVGTPALREEAAAVLHQACQFLVSSRGDDVANLKLLVECIDATVNFGSSEYRDASYYFVSLRSLGSLFNEPVLSPAPLDAARAVVPSRRMPGWLVTDHVFRHLIWRASQAGYRRPRAGQQGPPTPPPLAQDLLGDLLLLCTYRYQTVQMSARSPVERLLKRFPGAADGALRSLAGAFYPGSGTPGGAVGAGGDTAATEEERALRAVGAAAVLSTRVMLRRVTQNDKAMATFMGAILSSSHFDKPNALEAISGVSSTGPQPDLNRTSIGPQSDLNRT